ncbi:hypothetical protein CXB51_000760 [Gossypium anomalum]|uniref:Uncharacterized protein n=1 Tax=Gossypium anomalum TaxID=47600 RepID=A0A8J6D915_9ROSI|nr:hypothetical protein CXB51_000760 [Gossypium anomalum]
MMDTGNMAGRNRQRLIKPLHIFEYLTFLSSCSSCKKLGKKKASSSWPGVMTGDIEGKRASRRKMLYKSSIQKAKRILRIKTGLANQRVMVESLMAAKQDAAKTVASLRSLNMRRNDLRDKLNSAIDDLVRWRALETWLMGFL